MQETITNIVHEEDDYEFKMPLAERV